MKFSKETISILKNFAGYQPHLLLLPGNKISTISGDAVVAYAEIQEEFPTEFGIYDLSEFLGGLSLFDDPELEFTNKYIKIWSGNHSLKFFSHVRELLSTPTLDGNEPTVVKKFPDPEISFTLSQEQLAMIIKTSSILKTTDLVVAGDGENISLIVGDKKNSTAGKYELNLGNTDHSFSAKINVSHIKFIPGEYKVGISKRRVSRWDNESAKLTYFVGLEQDSQF